MISLEQLLLTPKVDPGNSFDISADGETLAFSWNGSGKWELYLLPISANIPNQVFNHSNHPMPILPGPGNRFNPKFSPGNPKHLICAVDFDGSESFHLLLCNLGRIDCIDLTPCDTLQPNFSWSPDGSQIAFISNRSGNFDIYILDNPLGSETHSEQFKRAGRLIYTNGHPFWDVSWSPTGQWLACCAETSASDYGIHLVPVTGGEVIILSEGGVQLNASEPCWSPDGSSLAFRATRSSNIDEYYAIGIYDLNTRQIFWIKDEAGDANSPAWCSNGRQMAAISNKGAATSIIVQESKNPAGFQDALVRSAQCSEQRFQVGTGFHSFPRFTPDGQNIIVLFDSPLQPPDLWKITLGNGQSQPLTNSMPEDIEKDDLIMPEEIVYPGENDEFSIPALLYRPRIYPEENTREVSFVPAVINVHGGPNWHYSLSWNPFMAHLASRGWMVLAPNYRGSTGYGSKWQNANYLDMGGCDARDLAAGARFLINTSLVDPAHIAITGRSHGGFLCMSCLTQFPDLWAAGSGIVPFFDWLTSHYASRTDLQHWNIQNMGDPIENKQLWYERSPYNFLEQVKAPIQIICGGYDPRCPAVDSIAARDKLLALGKQVDFQLYANEGHEFLEQKNILDSETRRVNFLMNYL